jgi:hypothetical protein
MRTLGIRLLSLCLPLIAGKALFPEPNDGVIADKDSFQPLALKPLDLAAHVGATAEGGFPSPVLVGVPRAHVHRKRASL